jgi:hypothetical protein
VDNCCGYTIVIILLTAILYLITVHSIRYLGVIADGHLIFIDHVNSIVSGTIVRTNLIIHCFLSRDRDLLVRAFTVYVRPILESKSSVRSPRFLKDIQKVVSVQQNFTKRLNGLGDLDHSTSLKC